MSRSNPSASLERPCKKYLKWHGADGDDGGFFSYWDKEKKEDIVVEPGEFNFLILDFQLFAVTGYSKPLDSFCYSNEVRSVKDKLVIRSFGNKDKGTKPEVLLEGAYTDLKGDDGPLQRDKRTRELKYTRCIYILWEGEICHLQLTGTSFQHFMENIERHRKRAESDWVCFTEAKPARNGTNDYQIAIFEFGDSPSPEDADAAMEADKVVQTYLKAYFAKNGSQGEKGEDGAGDEDHGRFNPANWREFDMGGTKMGSLNFDQIREYHFSLEDADTDYGKALNAAMSDYRRAGETWKNATTRAGTSIADIPLKELEEMAQYMQEKAPMHGARLKIEYGLDVRREEERKKKQPDVPADASGDYHDEEDDIPF